MERAEIIEKLKPLAVQQLDVKIEEVTEESNIEKDLGADSLDSIEFLMAIDEEFDIEIKDNEAEKIKTVKDIVDLLEIKLG